VNFARDVVEAAPPGRRAMVELTRNGERREWSFGEVAERSARLAGTFAAHGVGRGDVVMTLIGNRPEWVLTMVACFRIGAVVLPCNEQLRAGDLRLRIAAANPKLIVADRRNTGELSAAKPDETRMRVILVPGAAGVGRGKGGADGHGARGGSEGEDGLFDSHPAPAAELGPDDPCLITFTSGTTGEAKGVVHAQRYLPGQQLQSAHWLGAHPGDLVWCTASSGWSKSARNVFIAPWLRGATALLHDGRFEPFERLSIVASEEVNVLCMAPTEYRVIAKRVDLSPIPSLRELVAAGEALNPEVLHAFVDGVGLPIRDGYGQTETGQLTGMPSDSEIRPGSMGKPLPGIALSVQPDHCAALAIECDEGPRLALGPGGAPPVATHRDPPVRDPFQRGELVGELVLADPQTDPTFFHAYTDGTRAPRHKPWHTGDRVRRDEDGYLYFEGRDDDLIISAGYRIGPFEVESALVAHGAVAEAAVVAAPDYERGAVVRAVVVLRDGFQASPELAAELQDHVKNRTAPYKYPRIVDFTSELPKTASGKVRRALLRESDSRR
jgi:acetyl-CoA synthetase